MRGGRKRGKERRGMERDMESTRGGKKSKAVMDGMRGVGGDGK